MLRTHDVVVAEGTFRVLLTPKRRVVAVLDAPHTMLGPLHVALQISRAPFLPPHVSPHVLDHPAFETAGFFDDVAHAIGHAAEGAFNEASKVATTIARPAFDALKGAAAQGVDAVAHVAPLPDATRRKLESAAHVILRAKLGDVTAKQFIRTIASAAKAGVKAAQHVGDTLLDASRVVAQTVDVPVMIASHVPGLGNIVRSVSPLEMYSHMTQALEKGDFKQLEHLAQQELSLAQGVVSLVPGIGTGVSAAIGAGLAALQGGGPLDIALRTAYGAIPIPPGLRQVTDAVLDAVLSLLHHGSVTDVAIQIARDQVPAGLARDVFDTLVQVVAHKVPIQKAGGALVEHFVQQYAPLGGPTHWAAALASHVAPGLGPLAQHLAASVAPAAAAVRAGTRMVQPLHLGL